jgi:hypothetical protein
MKVIWNQQDLSRRLSMVTHAVSSRSSLPLLAKILRATEQGRVTSFDHPGVVKLVGVLASASVIRPMSTKREGICAESLP